MTIEELRRNLKRYIALNAFIAFCLIVIATMTFNNKACAHEIGSAHCVVPLGEPFSILLDIPAYEQPEANPIAVFGPVTEPLMVPSDTAIRFTQFFVINAELNSIGEKQGLLSRDENGQIDSGHFTVSVQTDGLIKVRNQPKAGSGNSVVLQGTTPVQPGVPFTVSIVIGPDVLKLYQDGVEVASSEVFYPLSGNDLPLVIGGSCSLCTSSSRSAVEPIDGKVKVYLYRSEVQSLSVRGMGVT